MFIKDCRVKALAGISGLMMVAIALSGCAQKMTSNPALEEAEATYQAAQANPVLVRYAPLELQKAERALNNAEQILQQQGEVADIENQAYLAKQHCAIAQEIGNGKMAEAAIEQASAERNKVLLEARVTEATVAQERTAKLEQQVTELQAIKADRGLVMTLGDVVFDVNKADLKSGGIITVQNLANFLREYSTRRVMIEGFTDSTGAAEYNQALSERRALAVRQALLNQGIESTRIYFKGYGAEFPVASNATAAGRQMNRRVEIIISDEEGVIPARTQ